MNVVGYVALTATACAVIWLIAEAAAYLALLARGAAAWSRRQVDEAEPDQPEPQGFEVVPARAEPLEQDLGRYRVVGVLRESQRDVSLMLDALTAANAAKKAELRGVEVTSVERVESEAP